MSKLRKSDAFSKGKRHKGVAVLAIVIVAAVAIGVAFASTTVKKFEATIEQTGPSEFRLTLTNDPASNQTFASANIEVPAGFSTPTALRQTVAGGSKRWLTPVVNSRIELRSPDPKNALAAGESLTLVFTATASCSPEPYEWMTYVKQSNTFLGTGNDFVGNVPSVSVTSGLATFAITPRIGDPQLVGRAIGVAVEAQDSCGNRVTGYSGPAMISGLNGVTPSSLSFTSGLASASLTPVQPQIDAVITVTDPAVSSPSNYFDVVTKYCTPSDVDEVCEESDGAGTITVSTPRPPTGATMSLSFTGLGTSVSCGGLWDTRGALANIDPQGYTTPIRMTTRWDKSVVPGTGVANFVFCMSKDGVSYVVVPPCTKAGGLPEDQFFCELKRNRNGVGDLVIQYLIAPQDPWAGLR